MSTYRMPWQEFEASLAPMVSVLPSMSSKGEVLIEDEPQLINDVTSTDYCGNYIYDDGLLKRILISGGYVTFANNNISKPEYHFYSTDHQGNIRVVASQNGEVEQVNHYYPYGGLMGESTSSDAQPYKYNGKELDRHSGLDWYDYGARWYNGISWMTPDPLAEKYYDTSPYVYCLGNPVNAIDLDGRDSYLVIWSTQPETYGHAAFAIDNYSWDSNQKKYIANGSMTVYGLFPKEAYTPKQAMYDRSVQPLFVIDDNVTIEKLKANNFNSGEDYKPDGILKISTNYETDMKTKETLQREINSNKGYRGMSRNCSTFAREGVRSATGTNVKGEESFLWNKYVTPNRLFKETKELGNTAIIIDPENKTDYEFSKNIEDKFKTSFFKE